MEYDDRISTTTHVHLSWLDRFKVLCTGHLRVQVVTYTEFEAGAFKTESRAWTPPWRIRRSRGADHGRAMEAGPPQENTA